MEFNFSHEAIRMSNTPRAGPGYLIIKLALPD